MAFDRPRPQTPMSSVTERAFLITIDTEGDAAWDRPRVTETRNARFLPRFQALCEKYGFKPTYLTNHEMALDPAMQELGRDIIRRDTGEIGMHLHAWNSPPLQPLTADDLTHQPFLIEYPTEVLRAKVQHMTELLEQTFQTKMLSHRAGRWSFDSRYARTLVELGYAVDCSVTPTVSWASTPGDPTQQGGTDYSTFPDGPYYMDLDDISRPGRSPLLELPMTIRPGWRRGLGWLPRALGGLPVLGPKLRVSRWLRSRRGNLDELLQLARDVRDEGAPYLEYMLHSSEFMPGGSPNFPAEADIERLYDELEQLFAVISRDFQGCTLADYAARVRAGRYRARGSLLR